MIIEETELLGCLVITPPRFGDERGYFSETYNKAKLAERGVSIEFVQDNHSFSAQKGTLRGLHFQAPPFAQDKLVRVTRGRVLDVAVDVRQGSPSYLKSVGVELSAENGKQLLVPQGFLHGFLTLDADTEFLYKVSNYYAADCDGSIAWNDETLGVDWGDAGEPTVSEKDAQAPRFLDWDNPFVFGENC